MVGGGRSQAGEEAEEELEPETHPAIPPHTISTTLTHWRVSSHGSKSITRGEMVNLHNCNWERDGVYVSSKTDRHRLSGLTVKWRLISLHLTATHRSPLDINLINWISVYPARPLI